MSENEINEIPTNRTVTVPMLMSKKLISIEGDTVLFYINKNYGLANGLESLMDFSSVYPTDEDFCIINTNIVRVEQ